MIESLIETLGETGPVIVYNARFKNTRLKEAAMRYPDLESKIKNILKRVVDLLPIAEDHYYHSAMKGSWSIKSVLPTIAPELDYSVLDEVHDGTDAQIVYLEAISPEATRERKDIIEKHLLEYCKLDTLAMVKIAHFFETGEK